MASESIVYQFWSWPTKCTIVQQIVLNHRVVKVNETLTNEGLDFRFLVSARNHDQRCQKTCPIPVPHFPLNLYHDTWAVDVPLLEVWLILKLVEDTPPLSTICSPVCVEDVTSAYTAIICVRVSLCSVVLALVYVTPRAQFPLATSRIAILFVFPVSHRGMETGIMGKGGEVT